MKKKVIVIASLVVILVLAGFVFFNYFWAFGDGQQAGTLNNIVHKGYIFKTYEGKIIKEGFKNAGNAIETNSFEFSVEDEEVAQKLMDNTGKNVRVHYVEYKNTLPWRGMQRYVVDKIEDIK